MTAIEPGKTPYAHAREAVVDVPVTPDRLFAHLDDPARLGGHMEKPSMMMMGGSMTYRFDEASGRAVGAVITMGGSFLGIGLSVEEVVTVREPPRRKVWETRGQPHILIMGAYRMGFEIAPATDGSRLKVFIVYNHLTTMGGRILSYLFASLYARWCVTQMARAGQRHFCRRENAGAAPHSA